MWGHSSWQSWHTTHWHNVLIVATKTNKSLRQLVNCQQNMNSLVLFTFFCLQKQYKKTQFLPALCLRLEEGTYWLVELEAVFSCAVSELELEFWWLFSVLFLILIFSPVKTPPSTMTACSIVTLLGSAE